MKLEQMKKYRGIKWQFMPHPVGSRLVELYRQTGYILTADHRNGPWKRQDNFTTDPEKRIWHDQM